GHGLTLPMREITVSGPGRAAALIDWAGRYEVSEFGLTDLGAGGHADGGVAALAVHGASGVAVSESSVGDPLDAPPGAS
ncbi:hypothetical protein, partial [Streptomyces olivaceus]